jgi:hypothetical protein
VYTKKSRQIFFIQLIYILLDQSEDIDMFQGDCKVREIYIYIYIYRERERERERGREREMRERDSAYLTAATGGTDP